MPEKRKFNFKLLIKAFVYILALLIAIYLVLLASGYKFDSHRKNFVQTGSIYINSNPKDVKVYIDGQLRAAKTPFKLSYVLPGNYHLAIEKDDFKKWEKNIVVKPGIVSSESEVILFYNQARVDSFSKIEEIGGFKINQAKDELVYWTKNTVFFQKTNSNENLKSTELAGIIEDVDAGLNFSKLLIKEKDLTTEAEKYFYCSKKECLEPYDLNLGLNLNFDKGKITDDGSNPLLLSAQGNLYDISSDLNKYYIDSKVLDFVFFAGKIFYLIDNDGEVKISVSDPKADNKKVIVSQKVLFSEKQDLKFLVDYKKNKLYFIGGGHKLYLVNTTDSSLEEIKVNATFLNFDNNNFFLIQNSSELKVQGKVKLTDEEKSLHQVARYSSDPVNPSWLLRTNHLLFIRDRILKTVEIEGSNETDLYTFSQSGNINYSSISKNEIIVLDEAKLKKLTICEKGSLIDLW